MVISCNDPSTIGLAVQPNSDKINMRFTDTVTVTASTVYSDSIRSDNAGYNLLGSYDDPVFGKTSASFYAVANLESFNNSFGVNPIADSMILSLEYAGYYGDTTTTQSLTVYQLTEGLNQGTAYYSNQNFSYDNAAIGNLVFTPHPHDSVNVGGANQQAQLRIKLNSSLANSILNQNSTVLGGNAAFTNFFKGIYVKTGDVNMLGKGSILYFNSTSINSRITLCFHNSSSAGLSFNMVFDNSSARVNHFEHDYSGTNIIQHIGLPSPIVYSQAMGGVKTFINFPNLKHFLDSGKICINKAELIVTIAADNASAIYPPPANMVLYALDSIGEQVSLPDYTLSTYQIPLINSIEYDFVINDYIQRVLLGTITDHGLQLETASRTSLANRVIIGGGNNPLVPMKLKITYTKL
ncbi:MAG: DUF4270 domain-containing protein [Bacteroidota bacterium]